MGKTLPGLAEGLAQVAGDVSPSKLTPREKEIVILTCQGLSAKEIGDRLGIKVKTVDQHRWSAMDKTGTHKPATLVRWAIRQGLIAA